MTREEAKIYIASVSSVLSPKMLLAIKALEQEPCEDAISRQAVMDEIEFTPFDDYSDYLMIREKIEALPPVKPQEPKWIPVSERLPERAYGCLVTVEIDNVLTCECVPTILNYLVGYDGETWNNSDGIPIPYEVIAWMPLPKSYVPQERSDKI